MYFSIYQILSIMHCFVINYDQLYQLCNVVKNFYCPKFLLFRIVIPFYHIFVILY
jgi:hypothetical protein